MILDTSAIISIYLGESERDRLEAAIAGAPCAISGVSLLEASMVLASRGGADSLADLDAWIEEAHIEVVPFTNAQAKLGRDAFLKFGKGRHPAGLNFGDCASYALAAEQDEELLFVGSDFPGTDIRVAPY